MYDLPLSGSAGRPESIPSRPLTDVTLLASGLHFPEGPVWLSDGSVLVTEIERGTLTRVGPDGEVEVVVDCGGGPNGAAIGPDGAAYLCNNGGRFAAGGYKGGWIERVDLDARTVEKLYTEIDGRVLSGPNDIVFDYESDGFWVTDTGKFRGRVRDVGSLYYGKADGSQLVEVVHPAETPNGVGLSPDGRTLYWAETVTGRLRRRTVEGPGKLADASPAETLAIGLPGHQAFDSLAVDADGNVVVTTMVTGCITVVSPDGKDVCQLTLPPGFEDHVPTNICFGGPDLRTAYITLGGTGRLVSCPWPVAGLRLAYER